MTHGPDAFDSPSLLLSSLELSDTQVYEPNVKRFRGGLVFKAHRRVYPQVYYAEMTHGPDAFDSTAHQVTPKP